ncbi:MAG TPA: AIR synthase related protein, partial [Polyangiales bacterium]
MRERFQSVVGSDVLVGVGDDAAVLAGSLDNIALSIDSAVEGVHFERSFGSLRAIGARAFSAAISDLAAMAARPLAAVISLNLPRHDGGRIAMELYEGLLPLAERYHLAIAGGDTNSWDGPLVISVTALGEVTADGPLCRRGAQPGDRIIVTGSFGGSILGRHLQVEPRIEEALL